MTTVHIDHHGNELPRIRQTYIVWKREHLQKGSSASLRVKSLEGSRQMTANSSQHSSAGPQVEVHRGEAHRSICNRKIFAHQECDEDAVIK